ncbi:unnamed protein product [Closterium sp. Yama58-4]|nr:unnamed protein product [Closterium sp. Yama58-4]
MRGSSGVKRVGKYELGRTLGEGNFAKVKLGQDVESGRRVAIKVMDKDRILQHRMADQIKREVSIMKMVRHPNIVQLIELEDFQGWFFPGPDPKRTGFGPSPDFPYLSPAPNPLLPFFLTLDRELVPLPSSQ